MCQEKRPEVRQCVVCNRQLYGRSDKRFCDIHCKNAYHNEVRKSLKTVQSETTKILLNNLVMLTGILGENRNACTIDRLALERKGFRFDYVTDVNTQRGAIRYGIFNLTYQFTHARRVLVTIDKDRLPVSPFIFKRWDREFRELQQAG